MVSTSLLRYRQSVVIECLSDPEPFHTASHGDRRSPWGAKLRSEVLEGATELRIMLCKEKRTAGSSRVGTSVVAACGELTAPLNLSRTHHKEVQGALLS